MTLVPASSTAASNVVSASPRISPTTASPKTSCVYARHKIDEIEAFGRLVGRPFTCALVYNNAAPTWATLEQPWFVVHGNPNLNWARWVRAGVGRRLIVSQALIPHGAPRDWRTRGAAGQYDAHAVRLAQNLVRAGLDSSVVRLAFEANGGWTIDSLGRSNADQVAWRTYWRRFVRAMRSVRGSHFRFDWTVNAGYQPIPFARYYPGDDVVDIVGIDAYDSSVTHSRFASAASRWEATLHQRSGLFELVAFGRMHHKPMSIPEWGLTAAGAPMYGAGDDPTYVDGIAAIVRDNPVVYQSYFLSPTGGVRMMIEQAPKSLAAYRRHFGSHGDAVR